MATAVPQVNHAPFANPLDQTALDTVTANFGNASVTITIDLVGSVSQIQADWAAYLAATATCPTALISYNAEP
jgi:hypothetical protein